MANASEARETFWLPIGTLAEIPRRGARVVETPRGPVAVFRTAGDRLYAVENRCPHRGGPLSEGIVHGERVTCPLHAWQIELDSGEAIAPDVGCVARYRVIETGGELFLSLEACE